MKRKLVTLGVAGVAFAAMASGAQAKDSLSMGMVLEPPHLDPTAGAAAAIDEVVYANVFEGLTRVNRNGEVQPALAKSWNLSNDGLTYEFQLHEAVTFHDGAAFDCSDVKFSFERAMADDSVNAQKRLFDPITSIDCDGPNAVKITLDKPTGTFLFDLAWGDAVIVDPASADNNKTKPVGTGAFKFKRWVKGDRVELERYDDYWGYKVALASATFKFVSDPSAATASMMAGDLDAFANIPSPEALPAMEANPSLEVHVGTTEGETILALNNGAKPFDDIRVRRAIAHALDRNAIVDGAMFGQGTVIGSHVAPHNPAYVDLSDRYSFDPEAAKALLAEAGYEDGLSLRLMLPPPSYARRSGEIIAAQLAEIGVQVDIIPLEWAQWLDQVFKRTDYEMTIVSHTEPADIEIYARDKYYFNYDSPEFKDLYSKYVATLDREEAKSILGDLQRKLAEDSVNVFLFQLPKQGVWNAKVKGLWENSPIQANDLTEVYWEQ